MRWISFAIVLLTYSSATAAETPGPLCVLDRDKVPVSWRPPAKLEKSLSPGPWSKAEAKDAEYAKEKGVDEMIDYFKRKPSAVESLWGDSIEALIQVTYASANTPAFDAKVREAARSNLTVLVELSFKRKPYPQQVICNDFKRLLPLAIFAHELYPVNVPRTAEVTKRTNTAYRACGSLEAATGRDLPKALENRQAPPEQ